MPKSSLVKTVAIGAGIGGLACLLLRKLDSQGRRADALLEQVAASILGSIANVMGCSMPRLRVSPEGAEASAGAAEIVVNPGWLHAAMTAVCSDPTCQHDLVVGVLAHELCHVAHGDAFAPSWERRAVELRADDFAGVALARLGIPPEAFASIVWRITKHHSTGPAGYPSRADRVLAVRGGFEAERRRQVAR